jgi:hypothetical protein
MKKIIIIVFLLVFVFCFYSCDIFDNSKSGKITVTPDQIILVPGESHKFTADPYDNRTWSLEGATGLSRIHGSSGLLTVGNNETPKTLLVRASGIHYNDGTATVTVASPDMIPRGLTVIKPGLNSIQLAWSFMSSINQYTIKRSTNGNSYEQVVTTSSTTFTDTSVTTGTSYFYQISTDNINSQDIVFAFAEDYFNMPTFAQKRLIPITVNNHYYRFPVISGQPYKITWQNENGEDAGGPGNWQSGAWGIVVTAWQNDGTSIFNDVYDGFTKPREFLAKCTGYVTVKVQNRRQANIYLYQIFVDGITGDSDTGTIGFPE